MPIISGGSSGAGAITKIQTLTGSGASGLFDFTSIGGSYARLQIVILGRSDAAAATDDVYVRFNNDSGANYEWQTLRGNNVTASAANATADTNGIYLFATSGSTATASLPGSFVVDLPFYAATTFFKQAVCNMYVQTSNAAAGLNRAGTGGTWRNTAAITRVTVRLASGNWITGSTAILYGIS